MVAAGSLSTTLAVLGLVPASQKQVFGAPSSQLLSMDSPAMNTLQNDTFLHANQIHDQCYVEPYVAASEPTIHFPPFNQEEANIYRYRQQQGVNLGSWFVHENWMQPTTMFACASGNKESEYDIASGWGSQASARALLEKHWDTFIGPTDFAYLAGIGINTVRLPIGYWSLGPKFCKGTLFDSVSDVYTNSWSRVLRAINWAGAAGIGVLVDLHGAPGSQNGESHSGVSDHKTQLFDFDNREKTIKVLQYLAQELCNINHIVGIQLLNEPKDHEMLASFYDEAIGAMDCSVPKYIHDAFNLAKYSEYNSHRRDFVVVDHHSYFVFTDKDNNESASGHTQDVSTSIAANFAEHSLEQRGNLIIGEWSCALSSQSMKKENDPEASQKEFCTRQMETYGASTAGWTFWSYMKEGCQTDPGWCFKAAVGNKLPSSFHSYPNAASKSMESVRLLVKPLSGAAPGPMSLEPQAQDSSSLRTSAAELRRETSSFRRRQVSIHHRHLHQRESSSPKRGSVAFQTGYQNGYDTALMFARRASKVGFKQQCMMDGCGGFGDKYSSIGAQDEYEAGFMQGLSEAERAVEVTLAPANPL
ncbi:glycosyl hydrolase 5 (cellulase A) family protein [Pleurotus pulmonarius]|nr:Glucan 1,3-beta-glucosidase 3 [Pleurotus pulmonarius]KAF4603542.1 Glucan 1,3-beta-glucosidase 3 [Pleurotus pulmonarius]